MLKASGRGWRVSRCWRGALAGAQAGSRRTGWRQSAGPAHLISAFRIASDRVRSYEVGLPKRHVELPAVRQQVDGLLVQRDNPDDVECFCPSPEAASGPGQPASRCRSAFRDAPLRSFTVLITVTHGS